MGLMGRRDDLVDAALLVLAEGGLKGLTHRAVDAEAGLPSGSTANLFRTRDSLVRALLEEMERRDRSQFQARLESEAVAGPLGIDEVGRMLAEAAVHMASPTQAAVTRARLNLSLVYPDEVRAGHLRLLDVLTRTLESAGVSAPAGRAVRVAAFIDGALLHALTVSPEPLDRAVLASAIRALLR